MSALAPSLSVLSLYDRYGLYQYDDGVRLDLVEMRLWTLDGHDTLARLDPDMVACLADTYLDWCRLSC